MPEPWHTLAQYSLASQPGNERQAVELVIGAVQDLGMAASGLERLKTAVAEATMNAMEHGNHFEAALPVEIEVLASPVDLRVRISDQGGEQQQPDLVTPDLDAKLAGLQSPRGWGMFLIQNMVDELHSVTEQRRHTVELVIYLK